MQLPVFVYGTLLLPEIQARVAGSRFAARPASVADFRRGLVRGQRYPSLAPSPGGRVEGLLLGGVDAHSLARLDAYEGGDYQRIQAQARALGPAQPETCWLWLLKPELHGQVTAEPFDLEHFRLHHLARFLEQYPGLA